MNTFFAWLRCRWDAKVVFLLTCGAFSLLIYLYNMPMEAALLGLAVGIIIACVFGVLDFMRFERRHRELSQLMGRFGIGECELPRPEGLVEEDYNALARELFRENSRLRADAAVHREEMDDYYTLWAHQIKTPIAAMRLLTQSSNGVLSGNELAELETEIFRVEQYVELAMSYQRLDGDSTDLVLKRQSLDNIVRQAVRKYAKQFIRRGLTLDYNQLDCMVLTDEKWLEFVIEQLLSNALKYTKEGGITISMEGKGTLIIADTGIGIAPEDLPRIFEKGFTGYNGRADKKSTGIGLYLCRRVLKMLGHTVSAQSQPGKGTTIRLNLESEDLVVE